MSKDSEAGPRPKRSVYRKIRELIREPSQTSPESTGKGERQERGRERRKKKTNELRTLTEG